MSSTIRYNRRRSQRQALKTLGIVEKHPVAGHNVSHAMNKTKRVFKPNLQTTKVVVDGKRVSLRLDARTIRSLTKVNKELDRPTKAKGKAQVQRVTARAAAKAPAKKATTKK